MHKRSGENIAAIYNQAGADYVAYADGDPKRLFSFEGQHAYADRHVWSVLETKLRGLWATGATSITVLDAGCGPGTWLRRLVARARLLGFSSITARGFDVAQVQVQNKVSLAVPLLPQEVQQQGVQVNKSVRNFLIVVGLISEDGKMSGTDLADYVDQEFGSTRLMEFVANHDCSVPRLMEAIKEFRGKCAQKDDATVILLRNA